MGYSLFSIKSKAQQKKEDEAYRQRIFPFGEQQRQRDIALLNELIQSKSEEQERLFLLVALRDAYLDPDQDMAGSEVSQMKRWRGWKILRHLSSEEKASLLALARLSAACREYESYPDAAAVQAAAAEILAACAEAKQ